VAQNHDWNGVLAPYTRPEVFGNQGFCFFDWGWFVSDGIRWVVDPQHVPHNAANNKSCDSVHYDEWNDKSQLLGCVEWYNHDEFYRNDTLINGTDMDECSGRSNDRGRQYEYI